MSSSSLGRDIEASPHVRVRSWHHTAPDCAWPAAAHPGLEIAHVAQGAARYRLGSHEIEIGTGQAVLVTAGTEHATLIRSQTRALSIWIDAGWFAELAAALGHRVSSGALVLPDAARIAALFALLEDEASEAGRGRATAVDALAEALCVRALRMDQAGAMGGGFRDARVLAAIALVHDRYMDPIGVDDMADAARISRFHFSRLFREQTGKSPYRYLTDTRMDRALELLERGRYTVTEAAFSVGFEHLPRFAKAFRQRHGCSPSAVGARLAD